MFNDQEYVIHSGREPQSPLDGKFRVMRVVVGRGDEPMLKSVTPSLISFGEAKRIADAHNIENWDKLKRPR